MCLFEQRFWLAVLMRTTEETAITSFSYDHEIRENSKKLDWFTEGIFRWSYITRTRICALIYGGGGGGEGKFVPPPTHHANVYKFFATLRSYVLASFQQMTFKFGGIYGAFLGSKLSDTFYMAN